MTQGLADRSACYRKIRTLADTPDTDEGRKDRYLILDVVLAGVFMSVLDGVVVTIALSTITSYLRVGLGESPGGLAPFYLCSRIGNVDLTGTSGGNFTSNLAVAATYPFWLLDSCQWPEPSFPIREIEQAMKSRTDRTY